MNDIVVGRVRVTATGMISRKHAAQTLGITPKTMCEWGTKGFGPRPIKVSARVFYDWAEVSRFATGEASPGP